MAGATARATALLKRSAVDVGGGLGCGLRGGLRGDSESARRKAEAGRPPRVSESEALSA